MKAIDYNRNLKSIAEKLKLDRKIEFVKNEVNSIETVYSYKPLFECVSQYFTRHTLVNYLVDSGRSDEDIIKITGHVNPQILNHYKRKATIQDKQKIIDEADKANWF
jgi:uncharacterized membrane protein